MFSQALLGSWPGGGRWMWGLGKRGKSNAARGSQGLVWGPAVQEGAGSPQTDACPSFLRGSCVPVSEGCVELAPDPVTFSPPAWVVALILPGPVSLLVTRVQPHQTEASLLSQSSISHTVGA